MENKIVVVVKGVVLFKNRVLIVKRSESDEIGAGTWENIGGKIEFGEELEDALKREVREEVGLGITVDRLLYAITFKTDQTRQVVILTYKCITDNDKVELSEEHSQYKWATEEEFRELIFPPIIRDMEKYNAFPLIFEN